MTDVLQQLLTVFESERLEHADEIRATLQRIKDGRVADGDLHNMMRRAHSLKGAARIVGFSYIETLAHEMESIFQSRDQLPDGLCRCAEEALDEIDDWLSLDVDARPATPAAELLEKLRESAAAGAAEGSPVACANDTAEAEAPAAGEPAPVEHINPRPSGRKDANAVPGEVRVSIDSMESLLRAAGELHSDLAAMDAANRSIRSIHAHLAGSEYGAWGDVAPRRTTGYRHAGQTAAQLAWQPDLHTQVDRMQTLKSLSLLIEEHTNTVRGFRRHLHDLHESIKSVRTTPASVIFSGFRKMVRDVAATEGKAVEFTMEGLESAADRRVLQRMKDPVMHLIRNAISHGIETADVREECGKPRDGRVSLSVDRTGDSIRFVITDDGRGLDAAKIRTAGLTRGVISETQAAAWDEDELFQLIFAPGFTTADSITAISGRGVGMSAVREAVTELQGEIQIASKAGKGARITISVPVGFVVQPMLLVEWNGLDLAVPSRAVARIKKVDSSRIRTIGGDLVIVTEDSSIRLLSIGSLFGQGEVDVGDEAAFVLIMRMGGLRYAVTVDKLIAVEECVVQPPDFLDADRTKWTGVVTGADGCLRLVVNTEAIGAIAARGQTATLKAVTPVHAPKSVLVVDDSITTRTLEKSILEAHGYRVSLCVDGRDALEALRRDRSDLVVSDVEMPRMNGFELLAAIRADPGLANIPLILVTSLDKPEDKERGMKLGADAYVVKQRFDQTELLGTIERLV